VSGALCQKSKLVKQKPEVVVVVVKASVVVVAAVTKLVSECGRCSLTVISN